MCCIWVCLKHFDNHQNWINDESLLNPGYGAAIISPRTIDVIPTWWRHQMETFSALLAICAGNSPVSGEFPAQRPVTRSFDVFFDLRLNKRLSKQSWGWWFETLSSPLWRHHNDLLWIGGFIYVMIFPSSQKTFSCKMVSILIFFITTIVYI